MSLLHLAQSQAVLAALPKCREQKRTLLEEAVANMQLESVRGSQAFVLHLSWVFKISDVSKLTYLHTCKGVFCHV